MSLADEQSRFFRCIGEPTRLQILKLLAGGEKCVGEVVAALDKEQSLISHHLGALKACNIVVASQKAKKIYYRLADPRLAELINTSERLTNELPLCKSEGACHEGREDKRCC